MVWWSDLTMIKDSGEKAIPLATLGHPRHHLSFTTSARQGNPSCVSTSDVLRTLAIMPTDESLAILAR
jgi:hypothetical protein